VPELDRITLEERQAEHAAPGGGEEHAAPERHDVEDVEKARASR
jgi:hypothetical protein